MAASEAKETAKRALLETFADEGIVEVMLEEIERDDARGNWVVTYSFARPRKALNQSLLGQMAQLPIFHREMKSVTLNDDGGVVSIKNRRYEE